MYTVSAEAIIDATAEEAWAVQTDVSAWPMWNSHEQAARIEGPFVAGTLGWSKPCGGPGAPWTLTVDPPRMWASRSPLPYGELTGCRSFTPTEDGRLHCRYEMSARGPFALVFRVWFGPRIRRDMVLGFAEFEAEVRRRREQDAE